MKSATSSAPSRSKRSPDALRESQPRKREKYAKMACSLCKVRKVKCSGNQPCNRCEELHSQCTYNEPFQPDAAEYDPPEYEGSSFLIFDTQPVHRDPEFTVLPMNRVCDQMQQSVGLFSPAPPPRSSCLQRRQENDELPQPNKPLTPTDPAHTLSLTQDAMRERGLLSSPHSQDVPHPVTQDQLKLPDALINLLQAGRPLLELGREKVTQLFTIFRDEVYSFYPCINLDLGREAVNNVFLLLKNTCPSVILKMDLIDVEITKAVVAISLLLRDDTQSPLASSLEGQLVWSVDSCFDQEKPQVEDIVMAILLSIYLGLKHRPAKAWRIAGIAAKLCLELGIHRERFFEDSQVLPRRIADWKRLFACVYRLDRQCSFYSGLPWTLYDREINVSALTIEPQESYISTMITLDRNLSEIWTIVNSPSSQSKNHEERVEFLNFQLQKLVDKIPTGDFKSLEPTVAPPSWLQAGLNRFCRLRVHHIKILTQISASGSIRDLISNPTSTNNLVTAAAKSVDLHFEMVNAREISPLVLPIMIKLLLTSLSIMMFAVSRYPDEYGSLCSKPFETAIHILSDAQNYVKDPDMNILDTLRVLENVVETSQRSHSQRPAPLISRNEVLGNSVDQGEAFCEGSVFEEFPTPDSELFSVLGSMGAIDILHMDNIFG
ncbi:hypothetical protein N7449_000207 [Penicillium cf. viridicatum]|uniref:Zn(2)-C6 fungal-type domain-containing protein n=1 Tax=Penicillium cf. viridicatum TaxID=2972119 RepID=A0A9W9N5H9_9EURO|nr:hypothetical protein N7449_000207 [Penicillium cf. viridicatum]